MGRGRLRVDGSLDEVRGQGTLEDVFLREASAAELLAEVSTSNPFTKDASEVEA
jgi:hypothetical protein